MDSFPCPTPEIISAIPQSNTIPIPIPPQPCLEDEHPLGPLYLDTRVSSPRSTVPLPIPLSQGQEAKEVSAEARRAASSGADGADNDADKWEDANQGLTWEAYGRKPKVPEGFILNDGADYVPFEIRLPSGALKTAKYIKIEWGEDLLVYRMIDRDPYQYVKSFQATPFPSAGPL